MLLGGLLWLVKPDLQATEEAKDNVKFLHTLERHLRTVSEPPEADLEAFQSIQDTLLPLMESLRLIWVLSTYYSQDDTMGSLLQQIGSQIGELPKFEACNQGFHVTLCVLRFTFEKATNLQHPMQTRSQAQAVEAIACRQKG